MKLENILMADGSDQAELKISLSKLIAPDVPRKASQIGNLCYAAPEILQDEYCGIQVDYW